MDEPQDLLCAVCGQPALDGATLLFQAGRAGLRVLHVTCDRRQPPGDPLPPAHPAIASLLGPLVGVTARVAALRDVDPTPVLALLQSAHTAAMDTEQHLRAPLGPGLAVQAWRHELREALNGLVGWATIFTVKPDVVTRDRAAAKMRACEADLMRLLAQPPASP